MLVAAFYFLLFDTCNLIFFHMILGYLKLAISCKKIASFRSCSATRSCFYENFDFFLFFHKKKVLIKKKEILNDLEEQIGQANLNLQIGKFAFRLMVNKLEVSWC